MTCFTGDNPNRARSWLMGSSKGGAGGADSLAPGDILGDDGWIIRVRKATTPVRNSKLFESSERQSQAYKWNAERTCQSRTGITTLVHYQKLTPVLSEQFGTIAQNNTALARGRPNDPLERSWSLKLRQIQQLSCQGH
jgi:hypothetical protein